MRADQRKLAVISLKFRYKSTVKEIKQLLKVSESTVRGDINNYMKELEGKGTGTLAIMMQLIE